MDNEMFGVLENFAYMCGGAGATIGFYGLSRTPDSLVGLVELALGTAIIIGSDVTSSYCRERQRPRHSSIDGCRKLEK